MNRESARKILTAAAWCAVVASVGLEDSPRAHLVVGGAATVLLLGRLAVSVVAVLRGRIARTRLPLALLITVEGVVHALGLVRGGGVEAGVIAVFETVLLGVAVVATVRALRAPGGDALLEERITRALARFVPEGLARMVSLEVVILRFAFARRRVESGPLAFYGYAGESPWRLWVGMYPLILVLDEVVVQSLLPPGMTAIRVVVAALEVYGFVWLLGVYRSMVARPHEVQGGRVRLHRGALGSAVLDADVVETATAIDNDGSSRFPGTPLRMDMGGPRRVLLTLRRPVTCQRFVGTRLATRILISADDPDALCEAVRRASAGGRAEPISDAR